MPTSAQKSIVVNDGGSSTPNTPQARTGNGWGAVASSAGTAGEMGIESLVAALTASNDRANQLAMANAAADRAFQAQSIQQQMAYNSAEAELNRKYQTNMSNTSYQRAVQDMKAAGINPILAYTQGGASTPDGAAGTASSAAGAMAQTFKADDMMTMIAELAKFGTSALKGFLGGKRTNPIETAFTNLAGNAKTAVQTTWNKITSNISNWWKNLWNK